MGCSMPASSVCISTAPAPRALASTCRVKDKAKFGADKIWNIAQQIFRRAKGGTEPKGAIRLGQNNAR